MSKQYIVTLTDEEQADLEERAAAANLSPEQALAMTMYTGGLPTIPAVKEDKQ